MKSSNENSFGTGEGELIEIVYELPLPMWPTIFPSEVFGAP